MIGGGWHTGDAGRQLPGAADAQVLLPGRRRQVRAAGATADETLRPPRAA